MDRKEIEKLAIRLFQNVCDTIRSLCPETDQISMSWINGAVNLTTWHNNGESWGMDLDAHLFSDGDLRLDDEYILIESEGTK